MIWYILVCSLFGGLSVSCTQALGACIVTSIRGENQVRGEDQAEDLLTATSVQELVHLLSSLLRHLHTM
jgi:hypothetical protein